MRRSGTLLEGSRAMAAGGRNPQKSAMARAKRQAQMAQEGKGGGGASAKAERQGAGMDAKMAKTAARKAEVAERAAEKQRKAEEEELRQQRMKAKEEREAAKKAKEEAKKGGGGGGGAESEDEKIARLQKQWMPLVKKGEGLEESGDLEGALALYQEAMTGFRNEGVKRPKLKEKMDKVKAKMGEA